LLNRSTTRSNPEDAAGDEAADGSDEGSAVAMNDPDGVRPGKPVNGVNGPPSTSAGPARPLLARMDAMAREMGSAGAEQNATVRTVSQVAMAMTAGYVVWSLRGASLLASLLTSIPLWRSLDPLPILETRADKVQVKKARQRAKKKKDDQQDKLGTMVT
jgi:hypothetical protein